MATATELTKMIRLRSDDGEEFEIEESVAKQFRTNSKKHVGSSSSESDEETADEELKAWDAEFVKVDRAMLYDLMLL